MPIALDFGTCNTVVARWNEAAQRADTVYVDRLSRRYDAVLADGQRTFANVIPSLIHFGESNTRLLGQQVASEGLSDHCGTFRWLKLDLLNENSPGRWIQGAMITPHDAASAFVENALFFSLGELGADEQEEIVVTVPVESYDSYIGWIHAAVARASGGRRVRLLDEATACILGYHKTARSGQVYTIFDFGGGTLDISIVKVDFDADSEHCKCSILGRAGEEVGGVMIDQWMLSRMKQAEGLNDRDIEAVGIAIMGQIEQAKIDLSSGREEAEVSQYNDLTGRLVSHVFTQQELTDILRENKLHRLVARTLDRALDAAAGRYGTRKGDIHEVLMVGGSSQLLGLRDWLSDAFPDTAVRTDNPFGAIASGACRYAGEDFDPTLVHDYQVEGWNPDRKEFEYITVIPKGTCFPTPKVVSARYVTSACDQQNTLGLVVCERSEQVRREADFVMGTNGRMKAIARGESVSKHRRPLNPDNRDFIRADPPCDRDEKRRFVIGFGVDENKCLTVSIKDTHPGNRSKIKTGDGRLIDLPVKDYPLVRL